MSEENQFSDEQIVKIFQGGDKAIFDLLVIKYQSRIKNIVARFLKKDSASIDDVAQETFMNAYLALNNFRNESQFYTWLYRIAVNSAKNYLKSNAYKHKVLDYSIDDEESFYLQETSDILDQPHLNKEYSDLEQKFKKTLELLPTEMREIIIMRELQDLSYKEISHILQCPVGTVRSRLFRAREKLFELLELGQNSE